MPCLFARGGRGRPPAAFVRCSVARGAVDCRRKTGHVWWSSFVHGRGRGQQVCMGVDALRGSGSIHSNPTVFCRFMDRSIQFGEDRTRDPKGHV